MSAPLWQPSADEIEHSRLSAFMREVRGRWGVDCTDHAALQRWSVDEREVFDDEGHPLASGKGELVCTAPFPSTPVGFWNDPDGSRYRAAYFESFPGVWHQGDFAEWTEHGGMIIYSRFDAVLNPGGVRIGTAEIYRQVERIDDVLEALVIGQEWENDTRVACS